MGAKQGSTSGSTPGGPAGGGSADGDRRIGRRALIVGGAAAAVGTGVLARDELSRLWWRIPGVERPREDGVVDYAGARWVAASDANR
ncbi:N-acetylmuramoyl-L-alanine amidase, partial [Streptomyces violaceoruber]